MTTDEWTVVGSVAGVAGLVVGLVTIWIGLPWFRPRFKARVDTRRQAIRLDLLNKGRRPGTISRIAVIDKNRAEVTAAYGNRGGRHFEAAELPARHSCVLIINAIEGSPFPDDAKLHVAWGKSKKQDLVPTPHPDASWYGVESTCAD